MASKSDRQRRLERARTERRLARQAHRARRKRQVQAGIGGALALVLVVLGVTWALGGFSSDSTEPAEAADSCLWVPKDPTGASPDTTADTGTPPSGELHSGIEAMTIKTNLGDIVALVDQSKAPCAAASFAFLGTKGFLNGTNCTRLNTELKTLTCGDPKGDGTGGPSYQFADEDIPTAPLPQDTASAAPSASASPGASASAAPGASASASPGASATPGTGDPVYYAKGTIVMANSGANTNGSQFMIVYGDGSTLGAAYSTVGTITSGLELVEQVAQGGAVDADGKPTAEGKPNTALTIQQLTVATPTAPSSDAVPPSGAATPASTASAAAE